MKSFIQFREIALDEQHSDVKSLRKKIKQVSLKAGPAFAKIRSAMPKGNKDPSLGAMLELYNTLQEVSDYLQEHLG